MQSCNHENTSQASPFSPLPWNCHATPSPAIYHRSSSYPFGDLVPKVIQAKCNVSSSDPGTTAHVTEGCEYDAWVDSDGDVWADLTSGARLPLDPTQYKVIKWWKVDGRRSISEDAPWEGDKTRPVPWIIGWRPTAENINALPPPLRRHIHDLETNCDPAGTIAECPMAQHQVAQLSVALGKERDEVARLTIGNNRLETRNAVLEADYNRICLEKSEIKDKLDEREVELEECKEGLAEKGKVIAWQEDELTRKTRKLSKKNKVISILSRKLIVLEEKLAEKEKAPLSSREEDKQFREGVADMAMRFAECENDLTECNLKLAEKKEALFASIKQYNRVMSNHVTLLTKMAQVEEKLAECEAKLAEKDRDITEKRAAACQSMFKRMDLTQAKMDIAKKKEMEFIWKMVTPSRCKSQFPSTSSEAQILRLSESLAMMHNHVEELGMKCQKVEKERDDLKKERDALKDELLFLYSKKTWTRSSTKCTFLTVSARPGRGRSVFLSGRAITGGSCCLMRIHTTVDRWEGFNFKVNTGREIIRPESLKSAALPWM